MLVMIYGNQSIRLYTDVVHHGRRTDARVYVGLVSSVLTLYVLCV